MEGGDQDDTGPEVARPVDSRLAAVGPLVSSSPRTVGSPDSPRAEDGGPPGARSRWLAATSLVAGLVGWCAPLVGAAVALLCGYRALRRIRRGEAEGRGMALAGVTLGWIQLVVGGTAIVYLALGGPIDLGGKPTTKVCLEERRAVETAAAFYRITTGAYPERIDDLLTPPDGVLARRPRWYRLVPKEGDAVPIEGGDCAGVT